MKSIKKYIIYVIGTLIIIFFLYFIFKDTGKIKEIMFPFFISFVTAYLISPFVRYFEKKGLNLTLSIIVVFLLLLILMFVFVLYIIPLILDEFANIFKMLPVYINHINDYLYNIKHNYLIYMPKEFEDIADKNIEKANAFFVNKANNIIKHILSFTGIIMNLILTPIITYYLIKDKDIFKNEIKDIIPEKNKDKFIFVLTDIDKVLSKFVRGQIYISLFVALFTSVGLLLIKVKYAIIIGIIAGVLNIIPYFGPILGAIPAVGMGLLDSPYKGMWAFIIFILVQQVECGYLAPKIMSDSVDLHPITIILSLLIGEEFFGIWGMLFSVPITAIIKVILKDIFIEV
ncbi:AI-2E family transporter [Aceticella autotrophica]|uniref:AI-2E family transporter n=1 Tax=Aceticella autotrophica TaxID=2755338 RepID=A0A975AU90_9THEO|nr:AI-2E family transporter [Aceticella autotrophica]QSZ26550.1 AI-2E family transporter [Aceticella autotrophica]